MKKYWIAFATTLTITSSIVFAVRHKKPATEQPETMTLDSFIPDAESLKMTKNGKKRSHLLQNIYTKVAIDSLKLPSINASFLTALSNQMTLIKQAEYTKIGDLTVETDQLAQVVDVFRKAKSTQELTAALDA